MSQCPRCHQTIEPQAIACPYCRLPLKAYGHPGIPLHRASGDESLCASCTYDADDTCNFPQRPHAKECTLYQNRAEAKLEENWQKRDRQTVQLWIRRNAVWLFLIGLIAISLLLSL